ncbi:hypothetical protein EYF80_068135 [Liparis tanakae]|uniref:Uncharacterized protein n=1 Tax=Liparis tanakae TaxID=230148 RepID=A0A4Z2DYX7_9TELE|nr:hypothetical protein EYF80_068135 [Liparis tanakae]
MVRILPLPPFPFFPFFPVFPFFLPVGFPRDDASSVPPQDEEQLAEWTPPSSHRSHRGVSADSSHLHLRAAETPALLVHLAGGAGGGGGGGGAERRPLGRYTLRLSGEGLASYAPGPETSV